MSTVQTAGPTRVDREHDRMARQLRRAHEDLDYFVRALSHDMSANFMLLDSSFGRLKQSLPETLPANVLDIVSHVDACLDQSKRFLDDLIRLAKTGGVEMEPARVELAAVVDEVLFEQDELLRARAIRVEVHRPLPAVWYNRQRLKQIVTNLVRNAIRHGCDPEFPRIEILAIPDEDQANRDVYPSIRLQVRDNGPGIDPQFAEDVFLPGTRLTGASDEGSGMGLAIVRRIAEYYGGAARVDYTRPGGTTIEITLPGGFAVPAPTPSITRRPEKHADPLSGPRLPHRPRVGGKAKHGPH